LSEFPKVKSFFPFTFSNNERSRCIIRLLSLINLQFHCSTFMHKFKHIFFELYLRVSLAWLQKSNIFDFLSSMLVSALELSTTPMMLLKIKKCLQNCKLQDFRISNFILIDFPVHMCIIFSAWHR
jgi:hypothetical protein